MYGWILHISCRYQNTTQGWRIVNPTPLGAIVARHTHGVVPVADIDARQVATVLDTEPTYLRKLGCGMCRPGPGLAEKIERLSGGEIKREELVFPGAAA